MLWQQNPAYSCFGVDIKQVDATDYVVLVAQQVGFAVYSSYLIKINSNG